MNKSIILNTVRYALVKAVVIRMFVLLAVVSIVSDLPLCAMALGKNMAVIIDPVVDMNNSYPAPVNPPACGQVNPSHRSHQGLYGDIVTVLEENVDEVKIAYDSRKILYGFDKETGTSLSTFWLKKKHIKLVESMLEEVQSVIPNTEYGQEPTVRLTFSWCNQEGTWFSAGTRFKHFPEQDVASAYAVSVADYKKDRVLFDYVPCTDAIIEKQGQSEQQKRELCVDLVYGLINRVTATGRSNVIPYVLGGNSYIHSYVDLDKNDKPTFYVEDGVWQREGEKKPYSGYDCSELIRQKAQDAGIEFPFKISWAIAEGRPALQEGDVLQAGDIIWVPGHVMHVGYNNDLIEARGYGSGYGCVHIIPVSDCLIKEDGSSVESYEDLVKYYYAQGKLRFRNRQGEVQELPGFQNFKLLKLVD